MLLLVINFVVNEMACNTSTSSPSFITPVPARRKKAYSVSLQDGNLDISEVQISPDHETVPIDDYKQTSHANTCPYCGQGFLLKGEGHNGNANSSSHTNRLSSSLPSNVGRSLPAYDFLEVTVNLTLFIYLF